MTHTTTRSTAGRDRRKRALLALELFTGVTGVIGGLLLVARPDGSLLSANLSASSGSPFDDWRLPGLFLAILVGGGALASAAWTLRSRRYARELSQLYGLGLVAFELVEFAWIGFQPLEAFFAAVGVTIIALARSLSASIADGPRHRDVTTSSINSR